MLGQRLRRRPNIRPTLVHCFVFAGNIVPLGGFSAYKLQKNNALADQGRRSISPNKHKVRVLQSIDKRWSWLRHIQGNHGWKMKESIPVTSLPPYQRITGLFYCIWVLLTLKVLPSQPSNPSLPKFAIMPFSYIKKTQFIWPWNDLTVILQLYHIKAPRVI